MNILFFLESGSGNIKYLYDELIAINKTLNHKIIAGVSTKDLEFGITESLNKNDIPIITFEQMEYHKKFCKHIVQLNTFLQNTSIDIIHVQTNWQLLICYFASLFLKKKPKIIYTIHAFRNNESFIKRHIAKWLINLALYIMADHVIATCNFVYQNFKSLKEKLTILNIGIDELYIKHPFKEPNSTLSLIFPAIFREGKCQETIIKALSKYIRITHDKNALLILPGNGENFDKCYELAAKEGVSNQVLFPGLCSKEELLKYYDKANILVCSSISETYCQSIVEGICLGKCIITTPVGVATEIIEDKVNGFIFNTVDELCEILIYLNSNKDKLLRIGKINHEKGHRFSWNRLVVEYDKIFNNL